MGDNKRKRRVNSTMTALILACMFISGSLPLGRPSLNSNVKYVILTFDDGSFGYGVDKALPILEEFGYTGVVFVPISMFEWQRFDWETVVAKGWEMGGHSWNHADLTKLSQEELLHEVADSKRYLEQRFHTSVISFAYPFSRGSENQTVLAALRDAGYLYGREAGWHSGWNGSRSLQVNSYPMMHDYEYGENYVARMSKLVTDASRYGIAVAMFHGVNDVLKNYGALFPSEFRYCLQKIRDNGLVPITFKMLDEINGSKYASSVLPNYIYENGFENGNFSQVDGFFTTFGETVNVTQNFSYEGTHSVKFTSDGVETNENALVYKKLPSGMSQLYMRAFIFVNVSGIVDIGDRHWFFSFRNSYSGYSGLAWVGWYKVAGKVYWALTIRDGNGWISSFAGTPSVNQWYLVELKWVKNGTQGSGEMWVDGKLQCSIYDRDTDNFGDARIVYFGLETFHTAYTRMYLDSVVLDSDKNNIGVIDAGVAGDINSDGRVNLKDISYVSRRFGITPTNDLWDPNADTNSDVKIDLKEVGTTAKQFGQR